MLWELMYKLLTLYLSNIFQTADTTFTHAHTNTLIHAWMGTYLFTHTHMDRL